MSRASKPEIPADLPREVMEAQDLAISTLGRITQFWGFTFGLGQIYGLLFLSRYPLNQEQIRQRLHISSGSASMALRELTRWGVAHRSWIRGDRRVHYRAEQDFWRMISNVLNERERREIQSATELMEQALQMARRTGRASRGAVREEIDFIIGRMERLHRLYLLGQKLLDLLLSTLQLDISKYVRFLRTRA